jgi:hypothetical protein
MTGLSKRHKITRNPAFGLLPMLIFSLLVGRIEILVAISVALALSIIGLFVVNKHSRAIYQTSVIAFAISLLWSVFSFTDISDLDRFVVVEIIFVLSLVGMRLSRAKIVHQSARKANPTVKNYLSESFRVAFQTQYGLSIHLLFVLLFHIFGVTGSSLFTVLAELLICQIILVTIILAESTRLRILDKKLRNEEWLPIITEQGAVTGKVAKSVTKDLKNKYMHPIVRIALIYDGKIYLRERKQSYLLSPGLLDYPFEKYVLFEEEIDATVKKCIREKCGDVDIPLRFILKYVFENDITKRLVFLYVSDIEDEALFNSLNLNDGKLWTISQIDDNMGTDTFSECFELEYEYLKNTVLLAKGLF